MIKPTFKYYIGIDTGVSTGLAVWYKPGKKLFSVDTVFIHEAMIRIRNWNSEYKGEIFVRVEDARLRKWIPRQANEKKERGRAAGAGSVKRDARMWEDFLKDMRIAYEMVAPKNNKTKITANYFKNLTGHKGLTSSHARDAAMLVFGI